MPKLKRTLGLAECRLMGVGVILRAGIYALIGQTAMLAGNAVWMSFLLASLAIASPTRIGLSASLAASAGYRSFLSAALSRRSSCCRTLVDSPTNWTAPQTSREAKCSRIRPQILQLDLGIGELVFQLVDTFLANSRPRHF